MRHVGLPAGPLRAPARGCRALLRPAACAALMVAVTTTCDGRGGREPERAVAGPLSPEQARSRFQLDDGLGIELVAAEPLVRSPIAIAFDERERLWVVEMPDYPTGPPEGRPPEGRIVVLEDRDGDGRYEHGSVFLEQVLFATGVMPWRGGVFLTGQFGVHYLEDADGDGRADRREELYQGSYTEVSQHFLNSPTLGLDGWVYVSNGLRTETVIPAATPDSPVDVRGMDFRFDPRGGHHEAAAGMGQFGMAFDRWGRRFTVTNRNHVIHAVVPERYLRRNPHLAVPATSDDQGPGGAARIYPLSSNWTTSIRHAGTFTAACGIAVYDADLLPARYRGSAFTAEPTGNLVHQAILTPRGASFDVRRAREGVEFLASDDPWFRPVNLASGPDGALYVVDTYRAEVEHPVDVPEDRRDRMDFRGGSGLGRIWRIAPEGRPPAAAEPDLAGASAAQLASALESPRQWRRATAHRLLLERGDPAAVPALVRLARDSASPVARVHAAWLLESLGALEPGLVRELLAHPEPRVREHAVRLAERWLREPELRERLLALVADPDPRVRFQLALSLGELADDRIAEPLARIAASAPEDRWTRIAVASAANGRTAALLATLFPAGPVSWGHADGLEELMRELSVLVAAGDEPHGLGRVVELLLSWRRPPALRWQMAALDGLAEGTRRRGLPLRRALARLGEPPRALGELMAAVKERAADPRGPLRQRRVAVRLLELLSWEESEPVLAPLLAGAAAPELAIEAARTMAGYEEGEISRALLAGWRSYLPELRRAVLAALSARADAARALLEELEAGRVRPGELTPGLVRRLRDDPALGERAAKALGAGSGESRRELIARYRAAAERAGDARRGREVFRENCATCHRVDGIGVDAGPDISDTRTRTREALLEDILDPSAAIDAGYVSYSVVTDRGELSGFIAARSGGAITLRGPDGRERVVSSRSVREIRSDGVSAMPEGFEDVITVEEMRHLIEFLKNWRFATRADVHPDG